MRRQRLKRVAYQRAVTDDSKIVSNTIDSIDFENFALTSDIYMKKILISKVYLQ